VRSALGKNNNFLHRQQSPYNFNIPTAAAATATSSAELRRRHAAAVSASSALNGSFTSVATHSIDNTYVNWQQVVLYLLIIDG
jgi:hypothetical protein